MSSSSTTLRRIVALVGALLLVPLTIVLGSAPAQATAFAADGVVNDAFTSPISGVTVEALASPAYTTVASSTSTGSDGTYHLPLTAGTYHLRYSKAGYATTFLGGSTPTAVTVDGSGQISVDGEPVEDNALDDVTLTSTTTHPLTGTVRNASSTALSGITVEAFVSGDDETPVDTDTTNGSGAYALDLPSGLYQVRYTDPGLTYLTTWYDGSGPTREITVQSDGTLLSDGNPTGCASLCAVTLTTPPPATEFPIAGQVVDANGDPVDGVTVDVDHVGGSTDSGSDTTQDVGGTHGSYSVSVLPGTYQVTYTKTSFVTTKYGGQASPATITVASNGTLSVAPAQVLTANRLDDVTLASTPYAVTGQVQTAGRAGITGITVRAFPAGSTDPDDVVDTATSASGAYTVDLPIGSYDLQYVDEDPTAPTYTSTSLTDVQVSQGGALSVAGSSVAGLPDVQLAVSSADTPHPVIGSVVDANGAEVDNLTVTAVPQGTGEQDTDTTGADGGFGQHGRYRLMLKPGSYQIEVDGGADWVDTTYVGAGSATALVEVQLNGTVLVNGVEAVGGELGSTDVVGKTTYPLSGSVKEGSTALSGITVRAYAIDDLVHPVAQTTSVGDGTWSLASVNGLVVGGYAIEFSGTSGGNTYNKTYYGGATPTEVEMAQDGVALVGGSALVPANTLPAVLLTRSSADTAHPVTGEVDDANGDPVDGVTVTPSGGSSTGTATTASGGAYTLMLKPGTYTLTYAKTGFTDATYPTSVTVELDGTVKAGTTTVSALEPVTLEDATGDATISGRVVDSVGGAGLGGITVDVFPAGDFTPASRVATTTTATSGTVGAWSVSTLKIGTYDIRFSGTSGGTSYDATYFGGTPGTTPVQVGQGNVITVNAVPQPSGALGNTLMTQSSSDTAHPVTGEVDDANGDPIDGVTVTPSGGPSTGTATTASGGAYTLMLKPGTYTLSYAKTGFTNATYPTSVIVALDGSVTPASTLDEVTLEDTTGDATISGRAVSSVGGAGLGGITVDVFPVGDFTPASRVATTTTATSGTVGAWSVSTLKIGTYDIRFSGSSGGTVYDATYFGGATTATTTPVKVGQGNVITVNAVPQPSGALGNTSMTQSSSDTAHPVTGEVDDANGDPIDGVTVTPSGGPSTGTATTASGGAYTLMLKPGTYTLSYAKTGFTGTTYPGSGEPTQTVVVALDGSVTPSSTLEPVTLDDATGDATISGRVVNSVGGAGLGGITVEVFPVGDLSPTSRVATTTTATSGTVGAWSVSTLKIGTYDIRFSGSTGGTTYDTTFFGGTAGTTPVQVGQGNVISVNDVTKGGGALGNTTMTAASASSTYVITGDVTDDNGDPIANATVAATKQTTGTNATAVTDADGHYTITLAVGLYRIRVTAAGFKPADYSADGETASTIEVKVGGALLVDGEQTEGPELDAVSLLGTTTYSVTGTATNAGGTPIPGITVTATPDTAGNLTRTAVTAANGTFTIVAPVGSYQVRFTDNRAGSPSPRYQVTYYGSADARVKVTATGLVQVDPDGSEQPVANLGRVTLPVADNSTTYALTGTTYDPNFDLLAGVVVTAVPVAGTAGGNIATATSGSDGAFTVRVRAGRYQLRYTKAGYQPAILTDDDGTAPATITVSATGEFTAPSIEDFQLPVDLQLLFPPAAFKVAPKLSGKVAVGQVVTTTFGTLQGASIDKDYVVIEWFLDGKPADDYSTGSYFEKFKVPAVAATRKLSYRITIDDPDGVRASTVFTSKPVTVPKAAAAVKGVVKKGKLTVTLTVPGFPKPTGVIVVKDGKKKVAAIKLTAKSKGKAVLPLSKLKLKPGKHTLTLSYAGSKTINKAASKVRTTVKK